MKLFAVLACALFFCGGCSGLFQGPEWDEAWKDARGDNMRMRNDFQIGK
jgi:hypothetical protein